MYLCRAVASVLECTQSFDFGFMFNFCSLPLLKRDSFLFLAALHSLWDLNSRAGIEPGPSAVKAQIPNYWTTRELSLSDL